MKKLLVILCMMGLSTGCQPAVQEKGQGGGETSAVESYVLEEAGVEVLLPEGTMEVCDAEVWENGAVNFSLKESGDSVFFLQAFPKGEEMEETLGVYTLGETEDFVIQASVSTCGTLNQEDVRPLWKEMREKVSQMGEENLILLEKN